MRRDHKIADTKGISVGEFVHILNWRDRRQRPKLRVTSSYAALTQDGCTPLAGDDACAAQPLQFRNPTGVVEMHMRIQDELHIFDTKTKRFDVGGDLRRRLRQSSVNQDVSSV